MYTAHFYCRNQQQKYRSNGVRFFAAMCDLGWNLWLGPKSEGVNNLVATSLRIYLLKKIVHCWLATSCGNARFEGALLLCKEFRKGNWHK
jgi:hypothetical protein